MLRVRGFLWVLWMGCAPAAFAQAAEAVDLHQALPAGKLAAQVVDRRVVFIGETHVRYDHHLNQLALIRELHALDPQLAVGMEYFPRIMQAHLDDYIAGRIDEQELLRVTDYYENWGYDYRLYAPILRFAREQKIPLVALNVPPGIASAVAKVGMDGLSGEQRKQAPQDIEPADDAYRARLREEYEAHGSSPPGTFEHFVEAQLVWDEGMAESAALYLEAHREQRMVVLAGSGHLAFGSGIPRRVARRAGVTYAIVLNNSDDMSPAMADYVVFSEEKDLPAAGILGVRMHDEDDSCRISGLVPGGAGATAGLKKGDTLVAIDGAAVHRSADVKLLLWNKAPGDRVSVEVARDHLFGFTSHETFEVQLAAAP